MGVKYFNSEIISRLEKVQDKIRDSIVVIFMDGNQFLYNVIEKFKSSFKKDSNNNYMSDLTQEQFDVILEKSMMDTIDDNIIRDFQTFKNLKQIVFCLDGVPTAGKMLTQFVRRKAPGRYYGADNVLLFSDALVMAGSVYMIKFREMVRKSLLKYGEDNKISITLSLDTIPGEGEHKALDFLRYSEFVNISDGNMLIWSSDSDVPICLLSSNIMNVYVKTDVSKTDVIYSLSQLRRQLANTSFELDNCQILLNFAGNDFLPEMVNFMSIKSSYELLKNICNVNLINNDRTLNIDAFGKFLRAYSLEEINFYYKPFKVTRYVPIEGMQFKKAVTEENTVQFPNFPKEKALGDKLEFKRYYYMNIISHYMRPDELDDYKIADFEMSMAESYVMTFIWYYYYQNGYYIEGFEEVYYGFVFPPLINSIYHVVTSLSKFPKLESMLKSPVKVRDLKYFEGLKEYGEYHHVSVLQKEDVKFIQSKELREKRDAILEPFKEVYEYKVVQSYFIKGRLYTTMLNSVAFCYFVDPKKVIHLFKETFETCKSTAEGVVNTVLKRSGGVNKFKLSGKEELDF